VKKNAERFARSDLDLSHREKERTQRNLAGGEFGWDRCKKKKEEKKKKHKTAELSQRRPRDAPNIWVP